MFRLKRRKVCKNFAGTFYLALPTFGIGLLFLIFLSTCKDNSPTIIEGNEIKITGAIQDLADSTVLGNAIVKFHEFIDTTDDDGKFFFDLIPIGNCDIEITHPFYLTHIENKLIIENSNIRFYLEAKSNFLIDTLFYMQNNEYVPWKNNNQYSFNAVQYLPGDEISLYSSKILHSGLFIFDTLGLSNNIKMTLIDSFFVTGDKYAKFEVSDSNANLAKINFIAKHESDSFFDEEIFIQTKEKLSEWVKIFYSDRPLTIQGMCCSSNGSICNRSNMELVKGWNYILESHDTGSGYIVVNYSTPESDKELKWIYLIRN